MISGKTTLIAHLGYPTFAFKAPLIYNPWFDKNDIDAVVVPMGVKPEEYREFFPLLFKMSNIRGALVTMPHKVTTCELVDELTPTAQVAGAANAVLVREDGSLLGDQFDGAGFVRGVQNKGFALEGKRVLVVGNGGVGSPIAASLAAAGIGSIGLFDPNAAASDALAGRLREHYPALEVSTGSKDPQGYDLVVNATPLGMAGEGPPLDPTRLGPAHVVVDLVYYPVETPLLAAARAQGARTSNGLGMLVHQAAQAFTLWTGAEAPLATMRQAAEAAIAASFPHVGGNLEAPSAH
jgi:shikimate dehydrogenase